jgi:hypothetical protein
LRPVGVDIAGEQLHTAERFQPEFDVRFPRVRANAEETPFDHNSVDLAVSEYGGASGVTLDDGLPSEFEPGGPVEFHLTHGYWVRICGSPGS